MHKQSYATGPKDDFEPLYRTAPEFLRHHVKDRPNNIAFVFLSTDGLRQTVTWKELYTRSVQIAKSLLTLGIKQGEVVAISIRDSPEWLFIHYGIIIAGAIPFGISFLTPGGNDVISLLKRISNCSAIFLDPGPEDATWTIFKSLIESLDNKGNVKSSKIRSLRYCILLCKPSDATETIALSEFENMAKEDTRLPDINEDDIQMLFQSSGSTGVPKLIAHTHKSLANNLRFFKHVGLTGGDAEVIYNALPFRWMGGYMWNIYQGETRVTRSGMCKIPTNMPDFVYDAIRKEGVTYIFTLPALVDDLIKRELPANWSLRTIGIGGQPVAKHSVSCIEKGVAKQLNINYGTSEATSVSSCIVTNGDDFVEYACGRPLPGVELKVVNNNSEIVPPFIRGEICIRSEGMFKCYYNDEVSTRAAMSEDGWYKSGDAGYMTDGGIIYVEGRTSDTIVSGGVAFSPAIMETLLNKFEGIKAAMIVSVPDETLKNAVCACFVSEEGSDVNDDILRRYLERISAEKVHLFPVFPKYLVKFDAFPQTHTGKASRILLAEEAERRLCK